MAGCTAHTHQRMAAEGPPIQRYSPLQWISSWTSVQYSVPLCMPVSYLSERVWVVAWKPCIMSWKVSRLAFSSSVSAGSASNGASDPSGASGATTRLTAGPVTAAMGPVGHMGLVPVTSLAPHLRSPSLGSHHCSQCGH